MRLPWLGLVFLLACGGSGDPGASDASDPGASDASGPGDGSPDGRLCGGLAGKSCSVTEYCDYADNSCGVTDQAGTCKPRPDVCPLNATSAAPPAIVAMPTCACNGQVYGGECDANQAGVDVDARGQCPVPAGSFACGYTHCFLANQYCRRQPHTTGLDTFSCAALPAACSSNPGCACLQAQPCGNSCTGTSAAGMTLTCPPTP